MRRSLKNFCFSGQKAKKPKALKKNIGLFRLLARLMGLLSALPLASFAAAEGFPAKEILVQLFNFSVFAALLFFLARKPVGLFFHKRQEEFLSFERQSAKEERERKKELAEWQKRLKSLEERESGIRKKAQTEAERLVFQKKEELKSLKARLSRESSFLIRLEREKAKRDLLMKWRGEIARAAGLILKKEARSPDFQERGLKDFFSLLDLNLKARGKARRLS